MRAEAKAALDRDRVMERYMEDPDDIKATNGARWRLQETPDPPPFLATCETKGSQVEEAVTGRT